MDLMVALIISGEDPEMFPLDTEQLKKTDPTLIRNE